MIVGKLKRLLNRPVRYKDTRPTNAERFEAVFRDGIWMTGDSVSGPGSERGSPCVDHSLKILSTVCAQYQVGSIADIPCGDFNWFGAFLDAHPDIAYVGYDVVGEIVRRNRADHPNHAFQQMDITREVPPPADLIFCKDLVNHLFERDVWATLENMVASGSRLLLITSNAGFENQDLDLREPGSSRELDLSAAPYSLPAPLYADHYLSLWSLGDVATRLAQRG